MTEKNIMVLDLIFRFLIHFVNFCIWSEVWVQLLSFAYGYPVVPASFVKETILIPLDGLGTFVEIQLAICEQVCL